MTICPATNNNLVLKLPWLATCCFKHELHWCTFRSAPLSSHEETQQGLRISARYLYKHPFAGTAEEHSLGKEKGEMNAKEQKVSLHWFILQFTFLGTELSMFRMNWCIYYYLFSRHPAIYKKCSFTENSQPKDMSKGLGISKPILLCISFSTLSTNHNVGLSTLVS